MSEPFIKLIRSDVMRYLATKHKNAFILLTFIADRARRESGHPDGLLVGQCHIGDCKNMGLTRQEYRTALKVLILKKFIVFIENCRTRQKSTTGSTTIGTLVQLCDSSIYDINSNIPNHLPNHRPTTGQPPTNHEQEGIRRKKKEKKENIARSASRPRSNENLIFNFTLLKFEGISQDDRETWKLIYPHVNLEVELTKATEWLKANPSKSNKKNWRKFLTGWFQRTNDSIENKKAFRIASSGVNQDRRTKDIAGNPVQSPHTGAF